MLHYFFRTTDTSLLVTDSNKGKIWRIMYNGDRNKFGEAQLSAMAKRKANANIRTPHEVNDDLYKEKAIPGSQVYNYYCISCHQRNGKGDENRFPPLDSSEWVYGNKKRLIEVVLNGLDKQITVKGKSYNNLMPQHSFLKDEDIAQVLTYIRQHFNNNTDSVTSKEVSVVRKK